ncbi:DUF167 domain-containing protein [bacterium]|nr:DUF167 domain-containing protein [bacterium]
MIITIKVIPSAKVNRVESQGDRLVVRTTAPAVDDKANVAVERLLKAHFGQPVTIIRGSHSRTKVVRVGS